MNKHHYMTSPFWPGFRRLAAIILLVGPGLIFGGCVVGNDEFDEAKRQRDQYRDDSMAVVAGNDRLNKEVAKLYHESDDLASQLAMVSAVSLHNRLTADIGKPKPVAQPTRQPAASATTTRPRSQPAASGGADSGGTTRQRPSGGGGGNTTQRPSGGGSPPPSSNDGAVDWGSISF